MIDMGTYTPKRNLYKPDIGEKGWGDEVNRNWDILDAHEHERSEITDFFASPFWDNIPDKPTEFPPQPHTHEIVDIIDLADKLAYHDTQISRIKKDLLTVALNVMMNKALVHAETKDFYSIIADVITDEYPYGFKNTFETVPFGVKFDNDGGGTWTRAIKIPLTTVPSEYAQYKIVIQSNTMQIYSADGTLKADYGAETGVASDFWNNVKSDGSDIRIADQNYSQLYFWIEEFDYANKKAVIWVKIPANTTELYIAYGNADALPSAYNSGENTFEFFDDFLSSEGAPDTNIWEVNNYGVESDTELYINQGGYIRTKSAYDLTNKVVETKTKQLADKTNLIALSTALDYATDPIRWIAINRWDERSSSYFVAGVNIYGTENVVATNKPLDNQYHVFSIIVTTSYIRFLIDYEKARDDISHSVTDLSLYITAIRNWASASSTKAGVVDWVRILKLADPAEFGTAEVIALTTTGAFITVTFDFPEGVDKLLITADTDAQAIYYSTDDGQTWNAIEPDTETPLPETAYSVKWKFEFATYVRGYAFITW